VFITTTKGMSFHSKQINDLNMDGIWMEGLDCK